MPTAHILGIFAHPDDEVFCAGGTLAKYIAAGAEATVVSATRGEAGQIRDATLATRSTLGQVREQELRAACACLGVQRVIVLDHVDGTLRDIDRKALTDQVIAILDELQPDVVITFGADGAYGHPDHVTIGDVTTEAFAARRRGRLYHSHFPRSRLLLVDRLAQWLTELAERFKGPGDFARAFSLFTQETNTLGYAHDQIEIGWFPPGIYIVEQDEPATSLYLILTGQVDVVKDLPDGRREVLSRLGAGEFFGELALARHSLRTAHVIAVDSVTCLVFSAGVATPYSGRGTSSTLERMVGGADIAMPPSGPVTATTVIDVTEFIGPKMAAIAAHRTQYPIEPQIFPEWMLREMMGREYFVRIDPRPEPENDLLG